jgi:hypothetical protein
MGADWHIMGIVPAFFGAGMGAGVAFWGTKPERDGENTGSAKGQGVVCRHCCGLMR